MHPTSIWQVLHEGQSQIVEYQRKSTVALDGHSLTPAAMVAIARHGCVPVVEEVEVLKQLRGSVEAVKAKSSSQTPLYGVNTGFGGNSDTVTSDRTGLAKSLVQTLQSGVLLETDISPPSYPTDSASHAMLPSWVRAITATRINQCIRGHSAISQQAIDALLQLAKHHIQPIVPLRGSISASGDLMPLAYLAGVVEGSQDVHVTVGIDKMQRIMPAKDALTECGLAPQTLGPREALGIVNGTAASAAVAALGTVDAIRLAMLSACLTSLVAEGMAARVEWLHPFVSDVRPHRGQREATHVMRTMLQGSSLVSNLDSVTNSSQDLPVRPHGGLVQDRYPLRTAPQWLGPQYEDLSLAFEQVSVELNSTSDNPLTDFQTGKIYHNGNFQAASITSATEKVRSCLQMIGKMLFAQFTELVNHQMNNGLPPNLAADEPSHSFCFKGLDINVAAYQSELSFLANPISNHVQSAEMHNQAINSLALLSARYSVQAVDVASMMVAATLYVSCQAVDLRVMHATYLQGVPRIVAQAQADIIQNGYEPQTVASAVSAALSALCTAWWNAAALDAADRCRAAASAFVQDISGTAAHQDTPSLVKTLPHLKIDHLAALVSRISADLLSAFESHRTAFLRAPRTAEYLGAGTKILYNYIRSDLGIPMHHGLQDHPTDGSEASDARPGSQESTKATIGSRVSSIYEAMRDERLLTKLIPVIGDPCA